ncbi:MAG: hypothetical protein IKV54_01950 [Clostridia bacterium]|nr:hypothetical protein [Clostridia bacterium]
MTEYRINEIKRKIDLFPLLAVKDGVVISSGASDSGSEGFPRSGRWAAEFFSAASSLTFTQNARKSGLLSLYRGGEFREEILFFDTFSVGTDGSSIKVLCGEDPVPDDSEGKTLLPVLASRIESWISDILPEREKSRYMTRYSAITGCFKSPGAEQRKKSFSSPAFLVGALNKAYRKRFSTEGSAISIEAFSPEAKRAELILPTPALCAIVFLTTALITRCISPTPMSPEIKSRFILRENTATLSFHAPAKDIGYFSVSCPDPLDAIKIFPALSGELTGLYRLCSNTDCEFSLSVADGSAAVSYTFPSYMKRQRLRTRRESEAELEFYDILADFIL